MNQNRVLRMIVTAVDLNTETEFTQDTVSEADTVQTDSVVTLNRNKQ